MIEHLIHVIGRKRWRIVEITAGKFYDCVIEIVHCQTGVHAQITLWSGGTGQKHGKPDADAALCLPSGEMARFGSKPKDSVYQYRNQQHNRDANNADDNGRLTGAKICECERYDDDANQEPDRAQVTTPV